MSLVPDREKERERKRGLTIGKHRGVGNDVEIRGRVCLDVATGVGSLKLRLIRGSRVPINYDGITLEPVILHRRYVPRKLNLRQPTSDSLARPGAGTGNTVAVYS